MMEGVLRNNHYPKAFINQTLRNIEIQELITQQNSIQEVTSNSTLLL